MVRYWDTSALVPLLATEERTEAVERTHAADDAIVTWWGTSVECESALARRERQGHQADRGRDLHAMLAASWREVAPSEELRRLARRLVRTHALRAADALQLAAALTASDGDPGALEFLTYDTRLADAAKKEGFRVVSPGAT